MTEQEFIYWLEGYIDGCDNHTISLDAQLTIAEKIAIVQNTTKNQQRLPIEPPVWPNITGMCTVTPADWGGDYPTINSTQA